MTSIPAETISLGALSVRFVLEPDASGGQLSVFECDVPANAKMPAPHSHDGFEETAYGLEGVTTFTVEGRQRDLHPGEVVFIPRGAVHGFENRGPADARFLAIITPALFGPSYFKELAEILAGAAGGPPDQVAIAAVMRRHGLTPAV